MSRVFSVVAGIGFLIGIYLFLNRASETATIVNSISSNAIKGISTLQGRG